MANIDSLRLSPDVRILRRLCRERRAHGWGVNFLTLSCKQRLEAMLDNEWTQLLAQLSKTRGA